MVIDITAKVMALPIGDYYLKVREVAQISGPLVNVGPFFRVYIPASPENPSFV